MKKLLCIAFFSIAMMASTAAKKEIVVNNTKEVKVEKSDIFKEIKTLNLEPEKEISEEDMFFGCGSDGNFYYALKRDEGMNHRDARAERRAFVRNCRGGTWAWLSIGISPSGATF
ncbi:MULTISPECIES: hypothetical protein [unclassified Polaribacter]|uniref:hypothetical protein n=1 Tax=unclassified Polaribacter TaxID=196858 RepID=UPI0011BF4202|nr:MULTISPECIES: hypothetical protein [unclassified Polaribacter]TXD54212.1 hypothetical protein ES043_01555 [Polaribacter sp. IC063]TXD62477.1 hypothetical protein ES044_01765 [Polaribacter sp. IC066]